VEGAGMPPSSLSLISETFARCAAVLVALRLTGTTLHGAEPMAPVAERAARIAPAAAIRSVRLSLPRQASLNRVGMTAPGSASLERRDV